MNGLLKYACWIGFSGQGVDWLDVERVCKGREREREREIERERERERDETY